MMNREQLSELPSGWEWAAIEDVVQDAQIGLVRSRLQQNNEGKGFAYLKMNNVTTDGDVLLDNLVYVEAPPEEADRYSIRRGDILFNTRNSKELVGKTGLVRDNVSGMLYNNNLMRIRLASDVPPAFMVYQMCSPSYRERMERVKRATTNIAAIYAKDLMPLRISLAPLAEQHRIVEKIEELFSDLDAGVAMLRQVREQLKRYRQAVLKAAVEGKLTEAWRKQHGHEVEPADVLLERILVERRRTWEAEQLATYEAKGKTPPKNWQQRYKEPAAPDTANLPDLPDGWVWATVEQTGKVQLGRQRSPKNRSKDYPTKYIRAANITKDGIDISDVLDMEFTPSELGRYQLAQGDIVVSEASGSPDQVGKPAVWNNELPVCCFQNTVIRLRSYSVSSEYLLAIFKHCYVNKVFAKIAGGVGINHLSASKFAKIVIPLAPQTEQQEVADEIARLFSVADESEKTVGRELRRAERLRQSILKRAFEGKLVPQDPSDEPASVLLERIREEKKRPKAQTSMSKKHSTPPKASTQLTLDL